MDRGNVGQYSLKLSEADLVALNALAKQLGAVSSRGATAGSPSWRVLIARIAAGDLAVVDQRGAIVNVPNEWDLEDPADPVVFQASTGMNRSDGGYWSRFPSSA